MVSIGSSSTWRDIEAKTNRVLSIETNPTPENISKCNQQLQSPLFGVLPPEIRNDIFSLALLQHEDLTKPYAEHDFCYRPGHRARRIVSTELLLTCRRIWLEANHWPMEQAVHSFWFDNNRRPAWAKQIMHADDLRFKEFVASLTTLQQSRIKHIQVSAQMWWLEQRLQRSLLWADIAWGGRRLDSFTVTVRHSDWWFWERNESLRFEVDCMRRLLRSPGAAAINEFRLELETLAWRTDELRPILESLKSVGEHIDSKAQEEDIKHWELIEPFEVSTWSGPTNVGGKDHEVYAQRDKLDYTVTTIKWRSSAPDVDHAAKVEERLREQGSLSKLLNDRVTSPPHIKPALRSSHADRPGWMQNYANENSDDEDSDGFDDEDDEDDEEDEDGDPSDDDDDGADGDWYHLDVADENLEREIENLIQQLNDQEEPLLPLTESRARYHLRILEERLQAKNAESGMQGNNNDDNDVDDNGNGDDHGDDDDYLEANVIEDASNVTGDELEGEIDSLVQRLADLNNLLRPVLFRQTTLRLSILEERLQDRKAKLAMQGGKGTEAGAADKTGRDD